MSERLTVKAVAKLCKLSSHTLRAWEKRYSIVSPNRTPSGRRFYSLKDAQN